MSGTMFPPVRTRVKKKETEKPHIPILTTITVRNRSSGTRHVSHPMIKRESGYRMRPSRGLSFKMRRKRKP